MHPGLGCPQKRLGSVPRPSAEVTDCGRAGDFGKHVISFSRRIETAEIWDRNSRCPHGALEGGGRCGPGGGGRGGGGDCPHPAVPARGGQGHPRGAAEGSGCHQQVPGRVPREVAALQGGAGSAAGDSPGAGAGAGQCHPAGGAEPGSGDRGDTAAGAAGGGGEPQGPAPAPAPAPAGAAAGREEPALPRGQAGRVPRCPRTPPPPPWPPPVTPSTPGSPCPLCGVTRDCPHPARGWHVPVPCSALSQCPQLHGDILE